MDRQPILLGERVLLRPLRREDWDALWTIGADRQLWAGHPAHDRWHEPVFRAFFQEALAGGGALAIIDRQSGAIIGSSRFEGYDPHKTIYNRFVRWSRLGVFNRILAELAAQGGKPGRLMIDATHLEAHRTAASLQKKGLYPDVSGAPKAG